MGTSIVINKAIGGFLAILLFLNLNLIKFSTSEIQVEFTRYFDNSFYGNIIVKDQQYPIIVMVADKGNTSTINKKEDINRKEDKKEDKKKV